MMRNPSCVILLLALTGTAFFANAQSAKRLLPPNNLPQVRPELIKLAVKKPVTGFETALYQAETPAVPMSQSMLRGGPQIEEVAGTTTYDNQTNGTESARLHVFSDGDVGAAWTIAIQPETNPQTYNDRGTGYNRRSNWLNNITPAGRIESLRTGFTNYVATDNGTEFVLAHQGDGTLNIMRRESGQTNWTPDTLPSGVKCLWPKVAAEGENIYVIALTLPKTFGGTLYKGMDGHVLFWRSPDGGASWDIQESVVPGLDSSAFAAIGGDGYCIDIRGGVLAIGIFDSWNDTKIFKSLDGGDTWEDPITVFNFPLKKYVIDKGYTPADIPVVANPPNGDTLAIFTIDGGASMVVDNVGFVHFWTGIMYVRDVPGDNGAYGFYGNYSGLYYWQEINPGENAGYIAGVLDINNNDTLDQTGLANYGVGLTSMAAAASDENGGLYVAYSGSVENIADASNVNFRHIYLVKSPDYGVTWYAPIDLQYLTDDTPDSTIGKRSEGVFPSCYKRVTDKLHTLYQRDYSPGIAVVKTGVQAQEVSDLVYIGNADAVGIKDVVRNNLDFSISPNPASQGIAQLSFELKDKAETQVEISDLQGRLLRRAHQGLLNTGPNYLPLHVAGLADGVYFVRVQSGTLSGAKKLVVLNR